MDDRLSGNTALVVVCFSVAGWLSVWLVYMGCWVANLGREALIVRSAGLVGYMYGCCDKGW